MQEGSYITYTWQDIYDMILKDIPALDGAQMVFYLGGFMPPENLGKEIVEVRTVTKYREEKDGPS